MSEERKKPVWPRIATVLIGLPLLYVALFGPACWLVDWGWVSSRAVARTYRPILIAAYREDGRVWRLAKFYAGLFAVEPDWTITRLADAAGLQLEYNGPWPYDMKHDVPYPSRDLSQGP